MQSRIVKTLLPLAIIIGTTLGCGKTSSRPSASFSGTVTLDGKPLQAGSIQFTSLESGESAYVNLDSSGHFKVEFPEADVGARYDVTVGQPIQEVDAIDAMTAPAAKAVSKVPERYASRGTSKLSAKLDQMGENIVDFDLSAEPKK